MVPAMRVRVSLAAMALFLLTASSAGCASVSTRASSSPADEALAPVTKVTDGDTIRVTFQGRDERVRLIGIDTPEVPWYGGRGECFGVEAGLFARGRLSGRSVTLAFDVDRRDRYGRLLAYVYLDRERFNLTLVRLGYARADPVPPDTRMASEFDKAEREARASSRGMWSACRSGPDS